MCSMTLCNSGLVVTVERKLDCSYGQRSEEEFTVNLELFERHCQSSNDGDIAPDFSTLAENKSKVVD